MLQSIRELSEFTQKNFESMLLIVPWFHRRIIEMVMPVVLASAEPISGRLSTEQLSQLSTNILEFERYMINNGM
jgi:hypothetical protein